MSKLPIELTGRIITAYVEHNAVRSEDLPVLIRAVHTALQTTGAPPPPPVQGATPAQIRRSITHEALISFEDGKPYKQLKRHLGTLGMTPDDYRAKWGLGSDYPMVAASYSAVRSALAKAAGLGRKAATTIDEKVSAPAKTRISGKLGLFRRSPKST